MNPKLLTLIHLLLAIGSGFVVADESSDLPEPLPTALAEVSESTTASTTTPTPVTTKAPAPLVPEEGSWSFTEDNVTCIRADLKILFTLHIGESEVDIALSPNASDVDSNCNVSNITQILQLNYDNYALTFQFERDDTDTYVRNVSFTYTSGGTTELFYNDTKLFLVKTGNSYLCRSDDNIAMGNVTMHVYSIHLQAFGKAGETAFGTAEECEADDDVSDVVVIAVGCAIAGLIIVTLVTYLIGRRRSRQKGYTSV